MNELEKLYNALYGAGKTTKTFDEFKAQYAQDAAYRDKVYEVTYRDGLTKKDRETFFSTYSPQAPTTTPAPAAQPAAQVPVGEDLKKKESITGLPSAQSSLALSQEPKEEDYFTGTFGNILRGFDEYVPLGIGDFVDDMARAVATGYRQGDVGQAANKLILSGTTPTTEDIQNLINKKKTAQQLTPSKEFQDYQKTYEEEGKSFWGVVKGLANNPSVLPEIMLSSLTTMATNTDALIAGATAIGTGATIGATTGATAGATAGSVVPVAGTAAGGAGGALAGATSGAIASVPYAFGLASSVVEMGSTFAELLDEELGQKEMTKENVKAVLENPDKLNDIRNKAIARGVLIGTIDAFTGKLASGVGAKIVGKSAAQSATGAATKGAITRSVGAGAAIEAAGGSIGEAAARGAIGQEMDVSEIALEGLAELPGGVRSTIQARFAKPSYRVNGEKVSAQEVDNLIETMTPQQLANTKIDIKNDFQGRQFKIQDKIVTDAIKTQVKEANPELNDASLDAITQLEKELKKLDGNTTQTGKDKAAAIRSQIKNIQENQIQQEAAVNVIEAESPDATQKRTARIAELESVLVQPENEKGTVTIGEQLFERTDLENELQTLKAQQDAVQKQAAGQVPVQPTAGVGQEVAQGEPQAGPQGATKEGQAQEEVVSSKTRVNIAPFFNTRVENVQEAEQLRQAPEYKAYKETLVQLAKQLGIPKIVVDDVIGGYKNEAGEEIVEISNQITFEDATLDQVEEYAAIIATLAPEVQEATIAAQYVNEGDATHNANEYRFKVNNIDNAIKALKGAGITDFSINEAESTVVFTDVFDFADAQLQDKIGRFAELLDENNTSYEQQQFRPTESRYVDKGTRKEIIRRAKGDGARLESRGQGFGETLEQAIQRDAEFQGTTYEEYTGVQPAVAEEVVEEVVEEAPVKITPITASDVKAPTFTKDNSVDYEEDFREDSKGREYTYLSSVTVEATDADGETLGSITKLVQEDDTLSFTVEDADGRQIARGKEFDTLGQAKAALAEHVNKQRQKEADKEQKKVAKEKEKAKAKAEKAKAREKAKQKAKEPQVEEEVVEEVQGKMDELLELDPKARGTGQKILDGLDSMIKDIEKFEKGTLGVNIALPIMKGILQTIRALVQAGMTLQEAIKKAAKDSGTTVKQIVNGINAIGQIAPIQEAYDALMAKADALIARQKSRGIEDKKIVSNLDTMIRNSEVYKNATDAQRKIMEREARVKMGVGPRKAASIGRVIGVLKDITNVSRQEKLQIIGRIRELSRDVAKDLAEEIRGLAKEGKITAVQAANIIAKFGNVNLLNEVSVSNFVDYMARVFADAEYDNKISRARSRVAKARKNIATKIGIADGLMGPLQKLFAINPELIPDASLERYLELLDMFSASEAVLTLEEKNVVKKDVDAILNEINNEQSRADELAELFSKSDNQVFDDGDLDYAASLKKMVKEGEITEEDATLMRKYKQEIIPQVEPTKLSDEEIEAKKKEYITALQKQKVNSDGLPSADERRLAKRLGKLIESLSEQSLMKLNLTDLKNLLKVTENINNGYLPHYAQVMVEKLNAIKYGKILAAAIKKAKPLSFSALYSKFKAAIIRSQKGGIAEMVRRNPLFYIDQVFGDFKTKDIFNSLFEMAAEAEANFKAELKTVQNILENAEAKVAKSFKLNPDKTLMSKFKMMTYMIQLEYESNKGSEQVNPAAAYLKETIKHIDDGKSRFGERDANMLQEILDKYSKDGEIDIDKLYNSFNQAEKDAIADIRGINESLKDKAQYTAAIIRGDAIDPLNNYVHLNVLHDTEPLDVSAATDFLNQANNSRRPSTKAKSLIARTKGAKPLNFDVFASAQRGAKFVLMDYNLTEPIRTARRTINQATADLEAEGRLPKQQRDIKNAIEGAFEEAVSNLLTNSILQNSLADEAIDFISKQGYRAVLAGTGRFAAELTSNIAFAVLADPKAFSAGTKYKGIIMSTDAPKVLENVKSKQTNRIFPSDTLAGKFVDTSILSQASGIQGTSSKNPVFNKMQQIYNLTLKKPQNVVELTADTLISTPDKLVMRPLWFGSFANEFKKLTGKEVDFKKIAENDQAYMDANKDAIEQSKKTADERSVMAGATDNAFMGILKGTVKPNQSFSTRAFNNFNNYMTRFLIFEYVTARTAIYALVGDGSLSKRQGAAMLGAVATRMTVYTLLSQMLANGIMGLFGIGDDEEEDEKSLMQKIGQSLASTFTSLLLGRDFGNATKLAINYGVEEINERFLDFLREGEYDPYKDGIAFSLIPRDNRRDDDLGKLLINMGGAFTPALNTASLIYKNRNRIVTGETTKKDLAAIEREDRTVKERIPLEVLGHLGFVPFYKDVRKIVNNSIYSSIKEAERVAARNKQREADLLGGYENKEDLKRYNPDLYEKNFGEGSEWYESTKEEREAKEKEAKEQRAIKDRMNNYTPKDDDGFGSFKFGEGTKKRSKKSEGGFGSKKFGE